MEICHPHMVSCIGICGGRHILKAGVAQLDHGLVSDRIGNRPYDTDLLFTC